MRVNERAHRDCCENEAAILCLHQVTHAMGVTLRPIVMSPQDAAGPL